MAGILHDRTGVVMLCRPPLDQILINSNHAILIELRNVDQIELPEVAVSNRIFAPFRRTHSTRKKGIHDLLELELL